MKDRIATIEATLKKRTRHDKKKIRVRELVAYQQNDAFPSLVPQGEFLETAITSKRFDLTQAAHETENHVIDRIAAYVTELSEHGATVHAEDNFLHPENYLPPQKLRQMAYAQAKTSTDPIPSEEAIQREQTAILASKELAILSPKKKNQITRLSLNEFALYPAKKRGPLSLKGFKKLIGKIEDIAKNYPANFHLLLATIPVKINNEVENLGIYVECGNQPVIHAFAKAIPSAIDSAYPHTISQAYIADHTQFGKKLANVVSVNANKKNLNILFGGNFICKTAGGARFRVGVDICLDNHYKIAKTLVTHEVNIATRTGAFTLPTAGSHMVTSNTIQITDDSTITDSATQADPSFSHMIGGIQMGNKAKRPKSTFHLTDPAFGSHTVIDKYPKTVMEPHIGELNDKISSHNSFTIKLHALHIYRDQHLTEIEEVSQEINHHIVAPVIDQLNKLSLSNLAHSLIHLDLDRNKITRTLKEIGKTSKTSLTKSQHKQLKTLISKTVHLLENEEVTKQAIKTQLTSAKKTSSEKNAYRYTEPDTENLQTSGAARRQSSSIYSYASTKLLTGYNWIFSSTLPSQIAEKPTEPVASSSTANMQRAFSANNSTALSTNSERHLHREAPGYNIFLEEKLVILQCLTRCSSFTFPWNKVRKLNESDTTLLIGYLATLATLQEEFVAKKAKRAYKFGVHTSEYEDIAILLEDTKFEIKYILKHKTKTNADFSTIQDNIQRIQDMIPKLTNRQIEKALRREEICEARNQRRRQGFS